MRQPIQYALSYPERLTLDAASPSISRRWARCTSVSWTCERYPCLRLALDAGARGGTYPAAIAAADEEAVGAFLEGRFGFLDIPQLLI